MDYEYWLRLGIMGVRFAYLEEKLAGSRLYADNKTLGARVKVHKEINDMFKQLFGNVPDRWLSNYANAIAESKTDRIKSPLWFRVKFLILIIASAWRWNGKISRQMKIRVVQWVRSGFSRTKQ
jgi:hypothetical protein